MINLDYRLQAPIYEQVCQGFETLIKCGALQPNEKIPSVRELAAELSINPNTVQKAMALMESKGLIYCLKGTGSFVNDDITTLKQAEFQKIELAIRQQVQSLKVMGFDATTIRQAVFGILKEEALL